MSTTLKTYDLVELEGDATQLGFVVMNGCPDPSCEPLAPGKMVTQQTWGGQGIIVALTPEHLVILWSVEPRAIDFGTFAAPLVRRVFTPLIAKQLVSVQPMTMPTGMTFYLDYTYGETKLDKRCKSGRLPSRTLWRGYRWARTVILRFWSWLLRCWRWLSTRSFTSVSPAPERAVSVYQPKLPVPRLTPEEARRIGEMGQEWKKELGARFGKLGAVTGPDMQARVK